MGMIKVTLYGIDMGKQVQVVDQQLQGKNIVLKISSLVMWIAQLKWLKLCMMIFMLIHNFSKNYLMMLRNLYIQFVENLPSYMH